jgi:DNA-binding Lrp family transcriptional regulator
MADDSRELTLYVQSKKVVTSFYRAAPANPSGAGLSGSPTTSAAVGGASTSLGESAGSAGADSAVFFLSDDQSRSAALAEEIANHRGYRLRVVDIGKAGRIERIVAEHLRGIEKFPVLVCPSGTRLVGTDQFSEENLCAVMPTELKSVRALTYIKVKGGDLDRIRRLLEGFPEVKELHFLTGDWDILVVLEFSPATTNKRQVLDFVTDRIRGIPEVLDTSTLVPEYSVTKFPVAG